MSNPKSVRGRTTLIPNADSGLGTLDLGLWILDLSGPRPEDSLPECGLWTWDFGLGSPRPDDSHPGRGLWTLDIGLWTFFIVSNSAVPS